MALVIVIAATAVAILVKAIPVDASGNDYLWANATDCSAQYGVWSWCLTGNDLSPLGFGYRNCTDYAAYELNEQLGGNTTNNIKFSWSKWSFTNGNADGWKTTITNKLGASAANGTPAVGSVAWWAAASSNSNFGHVSIVGGITYNSDGSVKSISTADYNSGDPIVNGSLTWGNYATHTITPASGWPNSFLHVADAGSGSGTGSTADNNIVYVPPSNPQYIFWRGAALPVDYNDAVRYNSEGHAPAQSFSGVLPGSTLPANTVFRPIGSAQQYIWDGQYRQPILSPGISDCLVRVFAQPNVAVVPADWMTATMPVATFTATCNLPNGTLFGETNSGQQYIAWYSTVLPISYSDAIGYGQENYPAAIWLAPGYVGAHPYASLPVNTIIRPVGQNVQYLWDGSQLHLIPDPQTSSCLLVTHSQDTPAVVPADWSATLPQGSPVAPCNLPDSLIFSETGSQQQYISWRGAALPVDYADAVRYNNEGNHSWTIVAPGYAAAHPASLPTGTVIRPVGQPAQYLWDATQLHPIQDPGISDCLTRYAYPQNGIAVVPADWAAGLPISGVNASCTLPDGLIFGQTTAAQQYITWQGVVYPISYSDAIRYNQESYPPAVWLGPGYLSHHPYATLPVSTVMRPVGQPAQYLWDGSSLHLIPDPATSNCRIAQYGIQSVPDVVPADWAASLPISATNASCP